MLSDMCAIGLVTSQARRLLYATTHTPSRLASSVVVQFSRVVARSGTTAAFNVLRPLDAVDQMERRAKSRECAEVLN